MTRYLVSLQFALGTTTLSRDFIFSKKTASTLPCPFYNREKKLKNQEALLTFFVLFSTYPPLECLLVTDEGFLTYLSLLVDPQSKAMMTHAPTTYRKLNINDMSLFA